ncbi:hypothetical protein [Vibrio maerlii]|uniref:hypothetical protein n=1 Tax=Vibrio maerlii TaxID=2231648 RepID=UPI000F515BC2|nr:hypothetical protein [Vibrio maerlii]
MQELKTLYRSTEDDKVKFSILKEMLSFGNDKQYIESEATTPSNESREDLEKALFDALKDKFD